MYIRAHTAKVEEPLYSTMYPAGVKLRMESRIGTENRRISVMFSDFRGFTNCPGERSAEVVITELNKYLTDMETILLQYNAHIDKHMGDSIMFELGVRNPFGKWDSMHCCNWLNVRQQRKTQLIPRWYNNCCWTR